MNNIILMYADFCGNALVLEPCDNLPIFFFNSVHPRKWVIMHWRTFYHPPRPNLVIFRYWHLFSADFW